MATAVTNLTKHLEHVSDALAVSFVYALDFSIMFSYFLYRYFKDSLQIWVICFKIVSGL